MRASNFEILRIIAILGVTLHHLIINNVGYCLYSSEAVGDTTAFLINSLAVGGVNIFVLISGWFGIKRQWSTVFKLVVDCFFIGIIMNIVGLTLSSYTFSLFTVLKSLSFTNSWFVLHYICLVLLSPFIENLWTDIRKSSNVTYFLIVLTIINVVVGYGMKQGNVNGYNIFNFIYLYFIGRSLRQYHCQSSTKKKNIVSMMSVLGIIAVIFFEVYTFAFLSVHSAKDNFGVRFWSYNSPWVLCYSIMVFWIFSNIRFSSKIVNWMAMSVFTCYIVQTNPAFSALRSNMFSYFWSELNYLGVFICAIIIFGISIIVNYILYIIKRILKYEDKISLCCSKWDR